MSPVVVTRFDAMNTEYNIWWFPEMETNQNSHSHVPRIRSSSLFITATPYQIFMFPNPHNYFVRHLRKARPLDLPAIARPPVLEVYTNEQLPKPRIEANYLFRRRALDTLFFALSLRLNSLAPTKPNSPYAQRPS